MVSISVRALRVLLVSDVALKRFVVVRVASVRVILSLLFWRCILGLLRARSFVLVIRRMLF